MSLLPGPQNITVFNKIRHKNGEVKEIKKKKKPNYLSKVLKKASFFFHHCVYGPRQEYHTCEDQRIILWNSPVLCEGDVLNENGHHKLVYLNVWFPVVGVFTKD